MNHFITANEDRLRGAPSAILYHSPFLILEMLLTCIIFYSLPQLPPQPSLYTILLFIIYFILVTTIITLSLNIFQNLKYSIQIDLDYSLYYDFVRRCNARYGASAIYVQEYSAYNEYTKRDNSICVICQDPYADDDMYYDKSLLHCGHLYHKQCLRQWEGDKWTSDDWLFACGFCAHCQEPYLAHSQKYHFNENHFEERPFYQRGFRYFGKETLNMSYWDIINKEYFKYRNQGIDDLSQRPQLIVSIKNCMNIIISNIYDLGSKFIWKCIEFAWTSIKNVVSIISRFSNLCGSL